MQGYYRSGQDCVVCPAMAVYYLLMFVAALLAAGFLAAWMQRSGVNLKGNDVWEVRVLRCLHSECVRVTFDSAPAIILRLTMTDAGISVGVDFLQTLSMFKSFAFAWPSLINTTLAATAASTFNIDLVSPECTITITFVRKWVILQVFPVICGACLIVGIVTSTLVVELRSMWQQRARPDGRQTLCRRSAWRSAQDSIVGGIFTVAYYMCAAAASVRARNTAGVHQRSVCCRRYFMVVRQALEIFVCSAAPNGSYVLTSDPSIACWAPGSEQAGLVPYAALSLLAYGCGIPIAFMIAIRRNKEGIRRDQQLWLMGRGAEALDNLDFRVRARYARLYQGWWRTPRAMQLELEIFVLLPYVLRLGNLMAFSIRMSRYCRLGQCFEVVAGAHSRVCAHMDEKCLVYCWGLGIKSLVCVVSHSTVYFVFVFVFSSMCARMVLHCGKNPLKKKNPAGGGADYGPNYPWWRIVLLCRKMFIVLVTVLASSNAMFQASTCLAVLCVAYRLQAKHTPFVSPKTQEDAVLATSGWLKALPGSGSERASQVAGRRNRHVSIHQKGEAGGGPGALKHRIMDYNVLETVLISSCVAIILGGMVFQSAELTPGTPGYIVLTILVEATILCSLVTFVVVLVRETRNTCQKPVKRAADSKAASGGFAVGNPLHTAAPLLRGAETVVALPRPGRARGPAAAATSGSAGSKAAADTSDSTTTGLLGNDGIASSHTTAGERVVAASERGTQDARPNGSLATGAADASPGGPVVVQTPRTDDSPTGAHVSVTLSGPAPGGNGVVPAPSAGAGAAAARIQAARRASVTRRRYHAHRAAAAAGPAPPAGARVDITSTAATPPLDARLARAARAHALRGSVVRRQFAGVRSTGGGAVGGGGAEGPSGRTAKLPEIKFW